jgi:tetratricopeptide (TPR) repeat protein
VAASPPFDNRVLSHYRVVEQIGAGGMGVVFRAHDLQLERDVAIKVLPPGMFSDEVARKRFRKEALALAKLSHPNIATIFEFDSQDGSDFLVTEYIPGVTLDTKVVHGPLPARQVISLGSQLAHGLAAAHAQSLVHRDLKPSNLRITPDNRLKILDFGLAQLMPHASDLGLTVTMTKSQEVSGTLPYMAPEQLRGETIDARSDIWAVGAVLYEMATGKRPFPESNGPVLIDAILNREPERPSKVNSQVSAGLERVILKALHKDPVNRYQTARALSADLDRLTAGVAPLAKAHRNRRADLIAAGAVTILVITVASVSFVFLRHRGKGTGVATPANAIKARRSVAVLGFKNLTDKPDVAWLSTALSEMLTTELAAGGQILTVPGELVAEMKTSLSLPEADSYGQETLGKIRKNLGSDEVVLGSYLALSDGKLRVDMKLEDASSGEIVDSVTENGSESQISELISQAGTALRIKLGAGATSSDETAEVKASLPNNADAARYYSEGLEKLRAFDALGAKDSLEKAVALEPGFAPAHSALAMSWKALGYSSNARDEAKKGFDLSGGLEREQRLLVEGQYHDIAHEWPKAIENYRTLFQFFPDNLEYGLKLAAAQSYGGKSQDAMATIDQMRKLPAPLRDDPRIDIAEAVSAGFLGDAKRQLSLATQGADKAQSQGSKLQMAHALLLQCSALNSLGQPQAGSAKAEEAQRIFAEAGNRDMAASALNRVAVTAMSQGDYDIAREKFEGALAMWRELGDEEKAAAALSNIGQILKRQGELKQARTYYEQAIATFREVGNKDFIAGTLGNFGNLLSNAGDLLKAKETLSQAITLARDLGNKDLEETDMINLAGVLAFQGDLSGAQKLLNDAQFLLMETGDKSDLADSRIYEGLVLFAQGDLTGARSKYQEAINISNEIGEKGFAAIAACWLGEVDIEEGHPANAEAACRQSIAEYQSEKDTQDELVARAVRVRALLEQGKIGDAQKQVDDVKAATAKTQSLNSRLTMQIATARVLVASGNSGEASRILGDVLADATKSGFVNHQFEARLLLGEIEVKSGKSQVGRSRLTALEKDASAKGFKLAAQKATKLLS